MTPDWQTILDLYLQGEGSRAEVESLRLRLHLSPDDRAEIECSLRLADELQNAKVLAAPPAGAVERMRELLRDHVARHPTTESNLQMRSLRQDAEDAANSVIEGVAPAAGASAANEDLKQFREIADALAESSIAPVAPSSGAQDRMIGKLREFQQSPAGALDPAVGRRLSRQIQSAGSQTERRPDLKAATIDEAEVDGAGA